MPDVIFELHTIPQHFTQHIEAIIYFKDFSPGHSIEKVVPTGNVFLIFELDNIPRYTYHNKTLKPAQQFSKAWISGAQRHSISISAHEQSEMFVIQFKPLGAFPFLHIPVETLNDKVIAAEEILGPGIFDFRNELLHAENATAKFQAAEAWLSNRFHKEKTPPPYLYSLVENLQKDPFITHRTIIKSCPYTQKQLIHHFKKYVGLTPKYYHRVLRFNKILTMINNNEEISLTELAYHCEYADQSHFIKEFSHFSGFTPTAFLKQDFPKEETNFFPLNSKG